MRAVYFKLLALYYCCVDFCGLIFYFKRGYKPGYDVKTAIFCYEGNIRVLEKFIEYAADDVDYYFEYNIEVKLNRSINDRYDLENKIVKNLTIKYKDVHCTIDARKVFVKDNNSYGRCIKNDELKSEEHYKKVYFDTFFHNDKHKLYKQLQMVGDEENAYLHGQSAYINYLLYGPPGTGKSTFAYRMAVLFKRDIKSLDLRGASIHDLYYYLNNEIDNWIIVLDEFDLLVKYLVEMRKQKEKENNLSAIDKQQLESYRKWMKTSEPIQNNDDEGEKKKKKKSKFELRDLLEALQGSINAPGRILIATTNNLEYIKKECPELVRPGRLTPVLFDYANISIIQEISQHFYKKEIPDLPEYVDKKYSPAQLLDWVNKYDYDEFVKILISK